MSASASESSTAYLCFSKFPCYCGESADLWRSGTSENPGRLFLKCGMEKRCKYWFWEDEVSARSSRRYNARRDLDSTNPTRLFPSSKVVQGINDLQSELLLVRFAVIALVVAVVWLASKV
ncbi:hypothetical protein ACQ4PT_034582 [Festuca glaucescens]